MTVDDTLSDLTGMMLIAMPGMPDPRFEHSVVYMCSHSKDGAMGLIINKPAPDITLGALAEQLDMTAIPQRENVSVHFGGPCELGRGFVLHSLDYRSDMATLEVTETLGMTATLDVLEAIAQGQGPRDWRVVLGYAGWGPGQLENEIMENGWLTCPGVPEIIFERPTPDIWESALQSIGVSPLALSSEGGRA